MPKFNIDEFYVEVYARTDHVPAVEVKRIAAAVRRAVRGAVKGMDQLFPPSHRLCNKIMVKVS